MIVNLRESKARLSELVELASRGEDVLITVRGRIRARLTAVAPHAGHLDPAAWVEELKELHQACVRGSTLTADRLVDEGREDRIP